MPTQRSEQVRSRRKLAEKTWWGDGAMGRGMEDGIKRCESRTPLHLDVRSSLTAPALLPLLLATSIRSVRSVLQGLATTCASPR